MDARFVAFGLIATLVFVALDLRDPAFRASWSSDRPRLRRNLALLVANLVTMPALGAVSAALAGVVPVMLSWPSVVLEVVACLLVAELINWLSHWVKHRQRWLWLFHVQHHVDARYSVNLTLHTHGLEVLVSGSLMAAVLSSCGFSRFAVDVFSVCYYVTNLYKHSTARLSLGPLDALIVSPAYHRLHHAVDHEGNYGSVLTVFDVLFGTATFPSKDDAFARTLGVPQPAAFGFVAEMLAPFRR